MKKQKKQEATQVYLSDDLKGEIFLRLPIMSLVKFRYVIRDYSRLHNPKFYNIHLNRRIKLDKGSTIIITTATKIYKLDIDTFSSVKLDFPYENPKCSKPIVLVGSCNGLLCLTHKSLFYGHIVYLWNPVTGDYKELPPNSHDMTLQARVALGFGYDHNSCKFKVVVISHLRTKKNGLPKVQGSVYTLGTASWRSIEEVKYPIWNSISTRVFGGCPHWIKPNSKLIVSFDVGNEKFKKIPWPDFGGNSKSRIVDFAALGDHLSIYAHYFDLEQRFELWVRVDDGLENAWTKQLSVSQSDIPRSFPSIPWRCYGFKHGRVLSWSRGGPILFDLEAKYERKWSILGNPIRFDVYSYIESLAMVSMEDTKLFYHKS